MRCGAMRTMASMTSAERPLRGGSTTMTSGVSPAAQRRWAACPASAQKNSAFPMPLRRAFSCASRMAASTSSTPTARFA